MDEQIEKAREGPIDEEDPEAFQLYLFVVFRQHRSDKCLDPCAASFGGR